ncbi:hypothetical protein D3C87_1490890 [compost metagenome]
MGREWLAIVVFQQNSGCPGTGAIGRRLPCGTGHALPESVYFIGFGKNEDGFGRKHPGDPFVSPVCFGQYRIGDPAGDGNCKQVGYHSSCYFCELVSRQRIDD